MYRTEHYGLEFEIFFFKHFIIYSGLVLVLVGICTRGDCTRGDSYAWGFVFMGICIHGDYDSWEFLFVGISTSVGKLMGIIDCGNIDS